MFDWISKFFGGGQNNNSKPAPNSQSSVRQSSAPKIVGSEQIFQTRQREEEERRRREEERRRAQEEAAAAKAAAEASRKTVSQPEPKKQDFWQGVGASAQQELGKVGDFFIQGGSLIGQLGAMTNPFKDQAGRDAQQQQRIKETDRIRGNLHAMRDLSGEKISGNSDIDEAATRVAYGKGTVDDIKKVAGRSLDIANTASSVLPVGAGYNAAKAGFKSVAAPVLKETAALGTVGVGADVVNDRGITPESLLMNYGVPAAFGFAGEGAGRIINSARLRKFNGGIDELSGAERAAELEANNALRNLPDEATIDAQATQAGKIDDGIVSPSRSEQVRQDLSSQVEISRQAIQEQYQNTLMGLQDLFRSITPNQLAPEFSGNAPLAARQADFTPPEEVVQPLSEIPVPQKAPISNAIDTPIEDASKAAAESAPVPVPETVKTRTIDDMTDDEVIERFGKTREEIQASRAELEAEKTAKAERQKAKDDRAAKRAAVEAQAEFDAKDIFAGKKRNPVKSVGKSIGKGVKQLVDDHKELADSLKSFITGRKDFDALDEGTKTMLLDEIDSIVSNNKIEGELARRRRDMGRQLDDDDKEAIINSLLDSVSKGETKTAKADGDYFKKELASLEKPPVDRPSKADVKAIKKQAKEDTKLREREMAEYAKANNPALQKKGASVPEKTTGGNKDILAGKKRAEAAETNTRSQDLEEYADIDPHTNMPKEDLPQKTTSKSNSVVEKTVSTPEPKPAKDIFAGKKKADEAPKDAKKEGAAHTTSANPEQRKFTADAKGNVEEAKPSKTPPKKKPETTKSDADTDYILEKAKTGEKTRSQSRTNTGAQTRATNEVQSRNVIADEAKTYTKNTPVRDFLSQVMKKERKTVADEHVARAYLNSGRVKTGSVEYNQLRKVMQDVRNESGTTQGSISRFDRKNASHQEITSDYEDRFNKMDLELDTKRIDDLGAAYTKKRDQVNVLRENAIKTKSTEDIDKLEKAMNELEKVDRDQRIAAYDEAVKSAKAREADGQQLSQEQFDAINKLKQETGVFQYDAVDSSLLSATGTMFNNALNGLFGLGESIGLGKVASRIAGKITGTTVGGYSGKGARMGMREGAKSITSEVGMRNKLNDTGNASPMKKLWGAYKNAVTTGNELSETVIRGRIQAKTYDHYLQLNKKNGLKGEELKNQTRIDTLTDPLEIRQHYETEAYLTQGMSALTHGKKSNRIEKSFNDWISDGIKKNTALGNTTKGRAFADYAGKLTSRFVLGFPSVVWRSGVVAGAKRTPGVGLVIDGVRYKRAATAEEKGRIMAEAIEHAGSAATYGSIGLFLGASGIVTGAYPQDPNEQERWQAEGKTEWSIKIGNDYYDIRKSLGAFALPVMLYAQAGQNMAEGESPFAGLIPNDKSKATSSPLVALFGVTPVDSPLARVNDVVDVINGKKGWADLAATATRMNWPAAGFINELAKITTAASSGTELEARDKDDQVQEFFNRLAVAIPGGGEALGLDAKQSMGVDQASTSIIGRIFGAQKGYNPEGAAVVAEDKANAAASAQATRSVDQDTYDKVMATMDDDTKGLYKRLVEEGKTLPPEKQKNVDKAIAGLADGDSYYKSKFSEEGDWNTQSYVLNKKREVLASDGATKPSELQRLDREISRTSIMEQIDGDPVIYDKYKTIGQSELKKMMDDEDLDNYDPDTAAKLIAMDEMFTKHGLSYNITGDNPWTKKKYDVDAIKKSLSKRGRGGSKDLLATDVSGLKVQETDSGGGGLKYKSVKSNLPNIAATTPRKNFKKTISVKSGVHL